jgi:ferric iron reductase protein FhuF
MLRQTSLLPAGRAAIIEADRNRLLDRTRKAVNGFARNPLAVRLQQFRHPAYLGPPVVLRKACCLAYQLQEDGHAHGYCATCPSSSAEERIRRLATE